MVAQSRQENELALRQTAKERCTDLLPIAGGTHKNAPLFLLSSHKLLLMTFSPKPHWKSIFSHLSLSPAYEQRERKNTPESIRSLVLIHFQNYWQLKVQPL